MGVSAKTGLVCDQEKGRGCRSLDRGCCRAAPHRTSKRCSPKLNGSAVHRRWRLAKAQWTARCIEDGDSPKLNGQRGVSKMATRRSPANGASYQRWRPAEALQTAHHTNDGDPPKPYKRRGGQEKGAGGWECEATMPAPSGHGVEGGRLLTGWQGLPLCLRPQRDRRRFCHLPERNGAVRRRRLG